MRHFALDAELTRLCLGILVHAQGHRYSRLQHTIPLCPPPPPSAMRYGRPSPNGVTTRTRKRPKNRSAHSAIPDRPRDEQTAPKLGRMVL